GGPGPPCFGVGVGWVLPPAWPALSPLRPPAIADAPLSPWDPAAFAAVFVAAAAAFTGWPLRRHYQRAFRELTGRVATLREQPSLRSLEQNPDLWPNLPELHPLYQLLRTLVACYRQALTALADAQETIEGMRLLAARADPAKA